MQVSLEIVETIILSVGIVFIGGDQFGVKYACRFFPVVGIA